MKQPQHWQDWANLLLGICVFLSPWAIGRHVGSAVISNYVIVGIATSFLAIAALVAFRPWKEWIDLVLGAWLVVSPWLVGFSAVNALMWNAVLIGAFIIVCAWCALSDKQGAKPTAK
jgi:SPW repeat